MTFFKHSDFLQIYAPRPSFFSAPSSRLKLSLHSFFGERTIIINSSLLFLEPQDIHFLTGVFSVLFTLNFLTFSFLRKTRFQDVYLSCILLVLLQALHFVLDFLLKEKADCQVPLPCKRSEVQGQTRLL